MSEITLEKQLIDIIKDKEMPEHIKLAKLDMLVTLGVDVNAKYRGQSVLVLAVEQKLKKVYDFLKQNGAEEKVASEEERKILTNQLFKAVERDDWDAEEIKELINNGANVNEYDRCQMTPLMTASLKGNKEIVEILLKEGAVVENFDRNHTALMMAVRGGNKEVVELLIRNMADVNARAYNATPLMWAVSDRDLDIVNLLLNNGAFVDLEVPGGGFAMLEAVEVNRIDIIKALLRHGGDVNIKDRGGDTPLMRAATKNAEIIELLIASGADVNAKNDEGNTALMIASTYGVVDCVKALIKNGADVNIKNKEGQKAIKIAKNEETRKTIIDAVKERNKKEGRGLYNILKKYLNRS